MSARLGMCILFLCLISADNFYPVFAGEDTFRAPWGKGSFMEGDLGNNAFRAEEKDQSMLTQALTQGVKFFQDVISPVDGDRCPMYPSCSEYGIQALKKHGPFLGLMMIADRLMHERDEMGCAPKVMVSGKCRYYDPVANNDFWLAERERVPIR